MFRRNISWVSREFEVRSSGRIVPKGIKNLNKQVNIFVLIYFSV